MTVTVQLMTQPFSYHLPSLSKNYRNTGQNANSFTAIFSSSMILIRSLYLTMMSSICRCCMSLSWSSLLRRSDASWCSSSVHRRWSLSIASISTPVSDDCETTYNWLLNDNDDYNNIQWRPLANEINKCDALLKIQPIMWLKLKW